LVFLVQNSKLITTGVRLPRSFRLVVRPYLKPTAYSLLQNSFFTSARNRE